ncbi:helix-turn-helix domain-containing protein [Candidatus Pacearchaeota archaeon]|nr:helix-turn-helix domain-containing protein [Candidatus Pacearchaeota archaeon]
MTKVMPQEIEVWYLIPALRRELARIFLVKYGLNQKKAAEILGITESAISQYLNSKRGNEIKFAKNEVKQIEKGAEKIMKDEKSALKVVYNLCLLFRESKVICSIHKKHDKKIPKDCDVCFEK